MMVKVADTHFTSEAPLSSVCVTEEKMGRGTADHPLVCQG